jgi:protocatechuate 3,4-dioxygenase beta subunit
MHMRGGTRLIGALAAAGFACTVGLAAQRGATPAADGLLVGQVVDAESGRPLAQAVVWLGGPPRPDGTTAQVVPARILTGSDGRFVFRGLAPGSYTVSANRNGYLPGSSGQRQPQAIARAIAMPANGRVGDIVVRMWKAARLSGRVSDESGEPLVRVRVGIFRKTVRGGRATFALVQQLVTDDRGMYRAGGLSPGEYLVAMTAPVVAFPSAMLNEVSPPGARGGTSARAVAMGDFLVRLDPGIPTPPPVMDGRFRTYPPTFHPGTPSALQASVVRLRAGEDFGGVDIQLQPTGMAAVRGQIVGSDLMSAPGLQLVRADSETAVADMPGAITSASAEGPFVFPSVPDGGYTLRVVGVAQRARPPAAHTLLWAADPVVVSGQDVEVTVVLREGVRIRGHVQFEGTRMEPNAGVLRQIPVSVEPAYGGSISTPGVIRATSAQVEPSGAFTTAGVPGGSYVVRVTNSPQGWMFAGAFSGGRDISTSPVDILSDLDGVVLRFTDRWTGLQGTVRDARGLPDANATVLVFPLDPSEWEGYGPMPRRLRLATATSTGSYAVDPLPPGDYYAIAVAEEPIEWRDRSVLETLSRSATRVYVRSDGKTTLDLRTR